jgi:hypothetical protein
MKISPSGFPGLLLVLFGGVGAYVLFGRKSFLIIMTFALVAGAITAIFIHKRFSKPEQQALTLQQSNDSLQQNELSSENKAAEQVTAADTSSGPR